MVRVRALNGEAGTAATPGCCVSALHAQWGPAVHWHTAGGPRLDFARWRPHHNTVHSTLKLSPLKLKLNAGAPQRRRCHGALPRQRRQHWYPRKQTAIRVEAGFPVACRKPAFELSLEPAAIYKPKFVSRQEAKIPRRAV